MTIKDIRKAMRNLETGKILFVPKWGQIQKIGSTYAVGPLPENDDSDLMHDYSAWCYGWKESWILDNIKRSLKIS
jgi:hypothetical protein